jgi:hypothetical protein
MYKCITGKRPVDSLARQANKPIKWPSELGFRISPEQEAVLRRGMAINPADRFQSIAEMRLALQPAAGRHVQPNSPSNQRGKELPIRPKRQQRNNSPVSQGAYCPKCGRPLANGQACPHCSTERIRRIAIGALAAVLLVLLVALGIILASTHNPGPTRSSVRTTITSISSTSSTNTGATVEPYSNPEDTEPLQSFSTSTSNNNSDELDFDEGEEEDDAFVY